jgi:hypothetical protein
LQARASILFQEKNRHRFFSWSHSNQTDNSKIQHKKQKPNKKKGTIRQLNQTNKRERKRERKK